MNRITDEDNFRAFYDSALSIYNYIDISESKSPWGFDAATFSDNGRSTHAQFSCKSVSGYGKNQLTVTAIKNGDTFNLSHKVSWG
ncbi:hypothetical protein NK604_003517 [Vibrio parahaemolyticus]|nr:hypothetical protein [Vibrio parahaemolyticus]